MIDEGPTRSTGGSGSTPTGQPEVEVATGAKARRVSTRRLERSSRGNVSGDSLYRVPGSLLFFAFFLNIAVVMPVVGVLARKALPGTSAELILLGTLLAGVLPFEIWLVWSPRTKPRQISRPRYRRPRPPVTRRQRNEVVLVGALWGAGLAAGGIYLLGTTVADPEGGGVAGTLFIGGTLVFAASIRWLRVPVTDEPLVGTPLPRGAHPDAGSIRTPQRVAPPPAMRRSPNIAMVGIVVVGAAFAALIAVGALTSATGNTIALADIPAGRAYDRFPTVDGTLGPPVVSCPSPIGWMTGDRDPLCGSAPGTNLLVATFAATISIGLLILAVWLIRTPGGLAASERRGTPPTA